MRFRKQHQEAGERPNEQPVATTAGPHGAPNGEAPGKAGEQPVRRRSLAWRTRDAGAAAVGTVGAGVIMLARLVMTVATLIALLIGLAIVLVDVNANAGNTIVKGIHEGADFFAGSFTGLINAGGHPKRAISINWGIALVVYLLVGAILARVIFNVGSGGRRFERRHRTSAANY
jgi:hypothetical protein